METFDGFAALLEGLINSSTDDPALPTSRGQFVSTISKRFRGTDFVSIKSALVAAAVRCGASKAENLARETLHFVSEVSASQPVAVARPLATLMLQAAQEATLLTGHGGFSPDPAFGEQVTAWFSPEVLGSLDPRVVLDVIKYLAPLVATFAPPEAVEAVHAAAIPVVELCLASQPPALTVASGLIVSLGGELQTRWPLKWLLDFCLDHEQFQCAEQLVEHAMASAAAASTSAAAATTAASSPLSSSIASSSSVGSSSSSSPLNQHQSSSHSSHDLDGAEGAFGLRDALVGGLLVRGKFKQAERASVKLGASQATQEKCLRLKVAHELGRLVGQGNWRLAATLAGTNQQHRLEVRKALRLVVERRGAIAETAAEAAAEEAAEGGGVRADAVEAGGAEGALAMLEAEWGPEKKGGSSGKRQGAEGTFSPDHNPQKEGGSRTVTLVDSVEGLTHALKVLRPPPTHAPPPPLQSGGNPSAVAAGDCVPSLFSSSSSSSSPPSPSSLSPSSCALDLRWAVGVDVEWAPLGASSTSPSLFARTTVGTRRSRRKREQQQKRASAGDGDDDDDDVHDDDFSRVGKSHRVLVDSSNKEGTTHLRSGSGSSSGNGSGGIGSGSNMQRKPWKEQKQEMVDDDFSRHQDPDQDENEQQQQHEQQQERRGAMKRNKVGPFASVLQISTSDACCVFDLPKCAPLPEFDAIIRGIFSDPTQVVLGFGFRQDLQVLRASFPLVSAFQGSVRSVLDLGEAFQLQLQEEEEEDQQQKALNETMTTTTNPSTVSPPSSSSSSSSSSSVSSLSSLCERWLGARLDKTEQCSDWSARPLRPAQVCYAAQDAHVLVRLFTVLRRRCRHRSHGQTQQQQPQVQSCSSERKGVAVASASSPFEVAGSSDNDDDDGDNGNDYDDNDAANDENEGDAESDKNDDGTWMKCLCSYPPTLGG